MFFNAGSTFSMTGDNIWVLGTAGMNTMLSGASGGLTVFLLHYFMSSSADTRYSLVMICNGNLAGLVAVTGFWSYILLIIDHATILKLGQLYWLGFVEDSSTLWHSD